MLGTATDRPRSALLPMLAQRLMRSGSSAARDTVIATVIATATVAVTVALVAGPANAQPPNEVVPGVYRLDRFLGAQPYGDLRPLDAIVGNANIVGLGESVHTSGGFYRMKMRLIQYLVEERGFRALGIESSWLPATVTANYVRTCAGSPRTAARDLFGVWQSETMDDLLSWLCRWNQQHPSDPVVFFGFDIQQSGIDVRGLRRFLARIDIGATDPRAQALDRCYAIDGFPFVIPPPISAADNRACLDAIDTIDALLAANPAATIARIGRRPFDEARMHAIGLRAWQGQSFHFNTNGRASFEARDTGMAQVFEIQRRLNAPGAKTLIWAHDAHIAKGAYSGPTRWMGSHLAATHGGRYAAIAIVASEHYIDWPGTGCGLFSTATAPSVESSLQALGEPLLLVNLDFPGAGGNPLFNPGARTRLGHNFDMVPNQNYDGLAYLRTSLAIRPTRWADCGAQSVGRSTDPVPGCPLNPGHGAFCGRCGPCLAGEGDCDGNGECAPGLTCQAGAGSAFGFGAGVDVCLASGGGSPPPPPSPPGGCAEPLGGGRYCSACGPCESGQGDCDNDTECQPGLTCAQNVGADFGFAPGVDVCVAAGNPPPGNPPPGGCSEPLGTGRYCSSCGPCSAGQGDCDDDSECRTGLTCAQNVGADFGFAPGVDVCVTAGSPPPGNSPPGGCSETLGTGRYCTVCGPCAAGEGDCDNDAECQPGLRCIDDIGAQFGFGSGVDVCG